MRVDGNSSAAGRNPPRHRERAARNETTEDDMRFVVLVKASEASEAGVLPSQALLAAMGAFNEKMVRAGVLLAGERLAAEFERLAFALGAWENRGYRRTLRPDGGARFRLLAHTARLESGSSSPHVARTIRGRHERRDSTGVRGRGLRRGLYPRASGTRRTPTSSDRGKRAVDATLRWTRHGCWV